MIDQPVTPTQSTPPLPAETTPTGTDVAPKTYDKNLKLVFLDELWEIVKVLLYLAGAVVIGFSVFSKEFNISENTLIVLVPILAFIAVVVSVIYLWYQMNIARTFRIKSDSEGLTLQENKEIIKIAWNEVIAFQDDKVEGTHKQFIELPQELRQREILKDVIEKNAAKSITEHLVSRFENEGKVTLGIIEITTKGLLIEKDFISWEDIAKIGIDEENYLRVILMPDSNSIISDSTSEINNLKTRRIAHLSKIQYSFALGALLELSRPRPSEDRLIKKPLVPHVVAEKSVFISYRRKDSDYISDRIFESLSQHFGKAAIFKDVNSIPLGVDFRKNIDENVGKCQVLLAIIGDQWLSITNDEGKLRLYEPGDFVRIEIESALKREIPVIPLLVGKATIPTEDDLPAGLKDLAFRNSIHIRPDPEFQYDMSRLIESLEDYLRELPNRDTA